MVVRRHRAKDGSIVVAGAVAIYRISYRTHGSHRPTRSCGGQAGGRILRERSYKAPEMTGLSERNFNGALSAPGLTAGRSISVERLRHDQLGYVADNDAVLHSQVLNRRGVHHEVLGTADDEGIDIPEGESLLDAVLARSLDHG